MFELLLITALVVAIIAAFLFLRPTKSDLNTIVTKLESLNESVYQEENGIEFSCIIKHETGEKDQLEIFPSSKSDQSSKRLGIIPYEYKGRILHFINTKDLGCKASFNKGTEELTIDLIED